MIVANRTVGYDLFTETAFPDQGLGKMCFEIGEEGEQGKGEGGDKALIFLETCNFLVVGVS